MNDELQKLTAAAVKRKLKQVADCAAADITEKLREDIYYDFFSNKKEFKEQRKVISDELHAKVFALVKEKIAFGLDDIATRIVMQHFGIGD